MSKVTNLWVILIIGPGQQHQAWAHKAGQVVHVPIGNGIISRHALPQPDDLVQPKVLLQLGLNALFVQARVPAREQLDMPMRTWAVWTGCEQDTNINGKEAVRQARRRLLPRAFGVCPPPTEAGGALLVAALGASSVETAAVVWKRSSVLPAAAWQSNVNTGFTLRQAGTSQLKAEDKVMS
ncbi:MAG: hypothetical protein FRX49_01742 [Trebouxia sp. A1-2]|nr:MAG: hypothetical protein FRX49_01742 [Trebouxia sp. A1-2]